MKKQPLHKERKLTWRDVLDCKRPGSIDDFLKVVKTSGYRYFAWNGQVFYFLDVDEYLTYSGTGITVENLL